MGRRTGSSTLHPPDPGPAQHLGRLLAEERRCGSSFQTAWTVSVAAVLADMTLYERESWSRAFFHTRPSWSAAYLGVHDGTAALFVA